MVEHGRKPPDDAAPRADLPGVDTRSAPTTSPVEPAPAGAPAGPRSGPIGRFLVLDQLGSGGMGVVYAAYDPTLERRVAIKVLHGERALGAARGRAQLVAEALAMARLAHPNVIALHELGFQDGGAFLVMEYVAGPTLRGWLDAAPRSWREVLAMFVPAGEGLAAAHREGLVHRDFKPDNVLIDRDGRARVGDFGIATISEDARPASGSRGGTLPYMAPEQLRGEPCDARADQFAYCVALWEALHRIRPFGGTTSAARLAEITAARYAEPVRRPPEWLRAALVRGLAAQPGARWPSMAALLDAIRRDPRARRRRIAAGLGLAGVAGAALWLAWPSAGSRDPCGGGASRLAEVWGPGRKVGVHAAFAATGLPYAEDAWRGVTARLDHYAEDWGAMSVEACRATRVEGRQSDTLMDLRMACLDDRRRLLGALSAQWARGVDGDALEHALEAAGALGPIRACGDGRALSERVPPPTNPVQLGLIASARSQLDALQAALLTHRLSELRRVASEARARADATGWAPIRAQAALAEGELLTTLDDAGAEARLIEASQLADAARDDRLRVRALVVLVLDLAEHQQRASDALHFADLADGALARAGDDEVLRARLLHARGKVLFTAGNYDAARGVLDDAYRRLVAVLGPADVETLATVSDLARAASTQADYATARKLYEASLAVAIPALGETHPQVARLLTNLATTQYDSGDAAAATQTYRRALAIDEQVFGPDAPPTALTLQNLGRVEFERSQFAAARSRFERALAIRERTLGPDHPFVATTLGNLAMSIAHDGHYDLALADLERALAIKVKAYGPAHASVAQAHDQLGQVYAQQGDLPRALASHQRALALRTAALGATNDVTLRSVGDVGQLLVKLQRCREGVPLLERSIAALTRTNPPQAADMLMAATRCDLEAGQPARGLARLTAARAIVAPLGIDLPSMGELDFLTARTEWALGHRAAAVRWGHQAVTDLTGDADSAGALAEVRAWLTARSGPG